ncbi:uncharacterized protein N7483_001684 [Penicillium malachiteum]|uniref:uncharacterized protein n=1 Tax=Penicillium malachiteum TaxID=1324776 RepID=UPI0025469468|nr:uncharacterized protein N7483_001684 [Penicillium malachiteum]KAJ5736559.1 hypothetical protein N7483_001684 [Penicillium malachiteum]
MKMECDLILLAIEVDANSGLIEEYPDLPSNPGRDLNKKQYGSFGESSEAIEKRYFTGLSQMDILCVHPAYWRRGHGTQLVTRTLDLARMDGITQGVNAARMGARLYKALGYAFICTAGGR